jgi:hypothetical protein
MEYITNYKRRPDSGRRILFPSSWLDSNTRFFFFKNEVMDKAPYPIWELYPYQKVYIMKMKEGIDWNLMNFRCPKDLYDYLKNQSKNNYLSMTDYLIQLILKDAKTNPCKINHDEDDNK